MVSSIQYTLHCALRKMGYYLANRCTSVIEKIVLLSDNNTHKAQLYFVKGTDEIRNHFIF